MKNLLFIFAFLYAATAWGQRSVLIGEYEKGMKFPGDTSRYIFLNLDSVKQLDVQYSKADTNFSQQMKQGIWQITRVDKYGLYYVTFIFDDGTKEDAVFHPSLSGAAIYSKGPSEYSMYIQGVSYYSIWGKNGVSRELGRQLKQIKTDS